MPTFIINGFNQLHVKMKPGLRT